MREGVTASVIGPPGSGKTEILRLLDCHFKLDWLSTDTTGYLLEPNWFSTSSERAVGNFDWLLATFSSMQFRNLAAAEHAYSLGETVYMEHSVLTLAVLASTGAVSELHEDAKDIFLNMASVSECVQSTDVVVCVTGSPQTLKNRLNERGRRVPLDQIERSVLQYESVCASRGIFTVNTDSLDPPSAASVISQYTHRDLL